MYRLTLIYRTKGEVQVKQLDESPHLAVVEHTMHDFLSNMDEYMPSVSVGSYVSIIDSEGIIVHDLAITSSRLNRKTFPSYFGGGDA